MVHSGFFEGVTGLSSQPDAAGSWAQGSTIQADAAGSSVVANVYIAMWARTRTGMSPVEENDSWNRNSYLSDVRMVAGTPNAFRCGTG